MNGSLSASLIAFQSSPSFLPTSATPFMSGLAALSSAVTSARLELEKKKNAVRFFFGALGSFLALAFLPFFAAGSSSPSSSGGV